MKTYKITFESLYLNTRIVQGNRVIMDDKGVTIYKDIEAPYPIMVIHISAGTHYILEEITLCAVCNKEEITKYDNENSDWCHNCNKNQKPLT